MYHYVCEFIEKPIESHPSYQNMELYSKSKRRRLRRKIKKMKNIGIDSYLEFNWKVDNPV